MPCKHLQIQNSWPSVLCRFTGKSVTTILQPTNPYSTLHEWCYGLHTSRKHGPPERRRLLILDSHNSHVTLEVASQAKSMGLDMVTLPSHTSHRLQLLDYSIFKPFKQHFKTYLDYWTKGNVGEAPSKGILAHWISLALRNALSKKNIQNGFKATRIWPLNRDIIHGQCLPSEVYRQQRDGNRSSIFSQPQPMEVVQSNSMANVLGTGIEMEEDGDEVSPGFE